MDSLGSSWVSRCLVMPSDHQPRVGRAEQWARGILLGLYRAARGLSLLSGSMTITEQGEIQLRKQHQHCSRLLIILWRSLLVNIYWTVIPDVFRTTSHYTIESYADIVALLQTISVVLFAVVSFVKQVSTETKFLAILNRYIALYQRICGMIRNPQLFPLKFSQLYALKLLLTICGCLYELPQLLPLHHILTLNVGRIASGLIGIYMWMGTLFMLDACFLGFLVSGVLYEQMGAHIEAMLRQMRAIDIDSTEIHPELLDEVQRAPPPPLSHYRRMCMLGDRSDELDDCAHIYAELYDVTLSFRNIFQFQIFFYIYYNFIVLLLMLYEYIWNYLRDEQGEVVPLIMVAIKLGNIVLLIMCADYAIKRSRLPLLLPLDIVCSDIDHRWDQSVESFLSQLQTQQLEIKVLGILQLNNEFIPVILSAIVSYLFILIQFGFTGGFDVAQEIAKRNLSMARN